MVFFFPQHSETQGEVFQFSLQNLSLTKKSLGVFEGSSRNAYIRQGASNQQVFFPTTLPEVARSRIRQSCVSKRNGCSEPHLFRSPCAAALPATARDNRKALWLEDKQKN